MFSAWENHTEIAKALIDKGADAGLRDNNGWTALMRAVFKGRQDTVKFLLERGADASATANDGKTALQIATEQRHAEIIQLLNHTNTTKGESSL